MLFCRSLSFLCASVSRRYTDGEEEEVVDLKSFQ